MSFVKNFMQNSYEIATNLITFGKIGIGRLGSNFVFASENVSSILSVIIFVYSNNAVY